MSALKVLCFVLVVGWVYPQQNLVRDIDINYVGSRAIDKDAENMVPQSPATDQPKSAVVKRLWGVHNANALTGRIFSYKIPNDAFEGDIRSYKVPNVPPWLFFNPSERTLEGVPTIDEEGHHYLTVLAESATSNAKDVFDVHVTTPSADRLLKEASCHHPTDKLTVLTVIIEATLSDLSPKKRIKLIEKATNLFHIDDTKIALSSSSTDPSLEGIVIMSGFRKHNVKPTSSNWMTIEIFIGCNGVLTKEHKEMSKIMYEATDSDKLKDYFNFPFIGWHVTVRNPVLKMVTKRDIQEGSGDMNYYTDYPDYTYDNDYDQSEDDYKQYEEFFEKHNPTPVSPIVTAVPSTEVPFPPFPGGESADFGSTVVQPTHITTQTQIPVKPTRVVVEPSPTVDHSSVTPDERPGSGLESSIQTYPSATIESTTPLLESSINHVDVSQTYQPIEPTSVPEFTDQTEYGMKNFAPVIKNRITKLAWVTGNVYKMTVPEDAFEDQEDGGTRNLSLVLKDSDNKVFDYNSWIQLNPVKQEIYALPLENHISKVRVQLEAVDSGHKSTMDELMIRLSQPKEARNYNHEFSVVLKLEKNNDYEFIYALDWQIRAIEKIAAVFGGRVSDINVRDIRVSPLIHISWTNVTLVDSSSAICPENELERLAKIIIKGKNSPTERAKEVFSPEFDIKHARIHYKKSCLYLNHRQTGGEIQTKHDNQPPVFRNQIDELVAYEGKVFRYKVKEDACYDFEDGSISSMRMRLLTAELSPPSRSYWLQFDEANREFYGLPLANDVAKRDYVLECIDRGEKKVSDALVIVVQPAEDVLAPAHFSLTIAGAYDEFMIDVKHRVNLVDKIAGALGDPTSANVMLSSVLPGSVKIAWHNSSLDTSICPHDEIERLRHMMTDDAGNVKKSFKAYFTPEWDIQNARVEPAGECLSGDTPTHASDPDLGIDATIPEEQEVAHSNSDYLLTFIIPAVLIAFMLILAGMIACCLWRRRRYAKMTLADDRTFVAKGRIPIIFAEELDDHSKSDRANTPVIMHEEKPPLPPPEYQRHSPAASAQPRGDRASADHGPYQPPQPPYASANGSNINPRRNMPPVYRKAPTYLPP